MDLVRDRQNLNIWNAIDAKNYKHAVKIIDKRLAKSNDEYLEAFKLYILGLSAQFKNKSVILQNLEEVACRKPPLSNPDAIEFYAEILEEVLPGCNQTWAKIVGELKFQCIKTTPKKEDLCLKGFEACILKYDLDHARQIANILEKNFLENHKYLLWNVTIMFLLSISEECIPDQKVLWGRLAFAQILKLASATRSCTNPLQLPVKSLQKPQEILLLHRLLKANNKKEQSIEYLDDPQLGPESIVAKSEWELWILKLKLLEESQNWQELFQTTIGLLKRARTKDQFGNFAEARLSDWIVWDALTRSAVHLRDHIYFSKIRAEIEAHLNPELGIEKSWTRNASLSWVKLHFDYITPFSDGQDENQFGTLSLKVVILIKYLYEYGIANIAYNDLGPYIEKLDHEERNQLLISLNKSNENSNVDCAILRHMLQKVSSLDLTTTDEINRTVNNLKLRYLLSCLQTAQINQHNTTISELFSSRLIQNLEKLIQTYKSAIESDRTVVQTRLPTDRHPADDLAILASVCLIKLGLHNSDKNNECLESKKISYMLQATLLLEFTWTHSKHNFQISLLLVRLYSYLGCGSLAMRSYQRLGLKQIQLDTLSYTLFDRISSLHPHPYEHVLIGLSDKRSPSEHIKKQQKFFRNVKQQISKNIGLSFKHESYNSIFEIKEVSDRLSSSITAISGVIEGRKISRLVTPEVTLEPLPQKYAEIAKFDGKRLSNNNDYNSFPTFEPGNGPKFSEICNFLPPPCKYRCQSSVFREHLLSIISSPEKTNNEHARDLEWLRGYISNPLIDRQSEEARMTHSEMLAHRIFRTMTLIIAEPYDDPYWSDETFQQHIRGFNESLLDYLASYHQHISEINSTTPAFLNTLNALFTAHETGTALLKFCSYLQKRLSYTHDSLRQIHQNLNVKAKALITKVVEKCTKIKTALDDCGWIDRVLFGTHGEVKMLVGELFIEEWAGVVVESWRENIKGLGYLKEAET
ncbi:BgTH12-05734 [Blumeria graminis f. sp. triticale]|uniref:BgTH12-05734 n=1 Tax=Blumeria graminis f. sp. triticale TaxID=1689686 RepID=A0A9W4GGL5_BLUGR|nr:BgTH12-05734 [Blumeria graminis f. sp. triticale]